MARRWRQFGLPVIVTGVLARRLRSPLRTTLPERQSLARTLSLEQVAAVIDCQQRLRDRFLFALSASIGMRVGQALGLHHARTWCLADCNPRVRAPPRCALQRMTPFTDEPVEMRS